MTDPASPEFFVARARTYTMPWDTIRTKASPFHITGLGVEVSDCWLCLRPLGHRREAHHPVPKSRGGRVTVDLHPICHRTIHAVFANAELARFGGDRARLAQAPDMAAFLHWIADKPADFHAPTRRSRNRR